MKTKRVPNTTTNITKGVVYFLLHEGHSASRVNVQGQFDIETLSWRRSGSRKGKFDIACCIKDTTGIGRYVSIDVKKGNDKLSKEQKRYKFEVIHAGGIAFEIESLDDFYHWYFGQDWIEKRTVAITFPKNRF